MMHKLRLLNINNVHLTGSYEHIFHELRWLCWTFCPLKSLPSGFHIENLVVLDLQHSELNILWEGTMLLENLKIIDLSHSKYLTTTPDFTGVPRLEKLKLHNCTSLNEVHPSIGLLSRLVYFIMTDCASLTSLPISIYNLSSLQTLDLHRCRTMIISPYSIGLPPSISTLCSLELLNLSGCNLTDGDIPNDIGGLFSLKELDLSWNNFCSLPYSLSQLSNLKNLYLRECMYLKSLPELPCNLKSLWLFCCTSLQSLPQLPRSLEILIANDCTSLKQIPNLKGLESLQSLSLESCSRLAEIQGLENLSSFHWMDLGGCSNLETTFIHRLIKLYIEFRPDFDLYLPRMEIPDCFKYQKTGSSISFDMPHMNNVPTNHFLGYTICGVQRGCYEIQVVIKNRTNGTGWSCKVCCLGHGEVSWVTYISEEDPTQGGDRNQISTSLLKAGHSQVERIGVHLVYDSSSLDIIEMDDRVYSFKRDCDYVNAAETSCSLSPKRLKV